MNETEEFEFRARAEREAGAATAPAVTAQAPGSQPLPSWSDRMISGAANLGLGLATGGPIGLAAAGGGEALKTISDYMNKGAYNIGGATTDVLAPHVSPEVAGGAGYAANIATQSVPTVLGGLVGKAAQPAIQSAGKRAMQSALKPTAKDLLSGNAGKAVGTMLDEGVNVSAGGAAKLQSTIDELNKQVSGKIASSPAQINRARPAQQLAETLKKFKTQAASGSDERAILDVWKDYTRHFPGDMPIQKAQAVKQGTYKALAGKYGEVGSASTEAQKALARGLRQSIEKEIPEVAQLNAKESALINALTQVERRTGAAGNRDIGGLAWIANDPKAAAAFFAGRSELFKSIVARMLYSGSGPVTTGAGATIGAAMGAESGRSP